jgi:hypothetical protein
MRVSKMKTLLRLGCATALVALAHPAMAVDSDSVGLTTSLAASCTLTTLLSPTETLSPPYPGEHDLGDLGYTCNFGNELQYPTLKLVAPGGTVLVNGTDGHSVQYRVKWDLFSFPPAAGFQTSAAPTTLTVQGPGDQGALPNVEQTGSVVVDVLGDLTHAGTYSDVLTFSISP